MPKKIKLGPGEIIPGWRRTTDKRGRPMFQCVTGTEVTTDVADDHAVLVVRYPYDEEVPRDRGRLMRGEIAGTIPFAVILQAMADAQVGRENDR